MTKKQKKVLRRIIISAVLLGILLALTNIFEHYEIYIINENVHPYAVFVLYLFPYIVIGYDILKKAFKGIIKGQLLDENFLMAIATIGAIAIALIQKSTDYLEAVAVMLFYQIGELFQSIAVGKSRKNISALMDIRPDYANLLVDEKVKQVSPDEVEIGSVILVQPGEKIPIDGVVIEGSASLDTSAMTGESVPRTAGVNDEVISGFINLSGVLRIRTTRGFGESTVSKILEMVENASSKKSKSEAFISRFAHFYTPIVCGLALALAVLPPAITLLYNLAPDMAVADIWMEWIYRALTFLVISCPCALVISIPLTFFAGIGGASKAGVLVKGSNYLELLSKTETVVMDKTGTLTYGVFEVTAIKPGKEIVDGKNVTDEQLLEYAAYVESYSNHPISKSLKSAYEKNGVIDSKLVTDVTEIAGQGVVANYAGKKIAAGNLRLMESIGVKCDGVSEVGTVVFVAVDNIYAGYIIISDKIKNESPEAISRIKKAGVSTTVMLTGDALAVADSVAGELGIDEVHAGLLPQNKVEELEKILEGKVNPRNIVAFVGDGINDAPVLSRADLGIAMGAMGSDAAIEAADIVLMDDNPIKIAKAIRIAKKCMRIVYENIGLALGIKLICLIFGALGIANMWWAIFADVGVMVIAVLNAIRALRVKNL